MPPPPKAKLAPEAVEALTAWVKMGAPWPDGPAVTAKGAVHRRGAAEALVVSAGEEAGRPVGQDPDWVKNPIDAFVLAKLEEKGLAPSPPADRRTLIRRVSFDLIGLPPTPEEVEAFVADPSPDAYEKLVDRLLASPRYGERWGRHWLDVARYADTKGYVFTEERRYPYAYTYRDYVIRAFNDDLPYDQFIVQQLAADRLPPGDDKRPLAALGFLTLGRRFLNNQPDIIDDRIDVTMRGLLGLTVACARCHDHKFDPIPTRGLLLALRRLRQLGRAEGAAGDRPAGAAGQGCRLRGGAEEADRRGGGLRGGEQGGAGGRRTASSATSCASCRSRSTKWKATAPGGPPRAMVLVDLPNPVAPHVLPARQPEQPRRGGAAAVPGSAGRRPADSRSRTAAAGWNWRGPSPARTTR